MRNASTPAHQMFSVKAFAAGLFMVAFIYAGIFGYAASKAPDTVRMLESRLASVTVPIERPVIPPPAEPYNYPPAPATAEPPAVDISETVTTTPQAEPQTEPPPAQNETIVETPVTTGPHTGPLEPAPLSGLFDDTPDGKMPRKGPNNLTPFNAYKRPYTPTEKPTIAIGVTDYGLSAEDSGAALTALPADVSFILSPYTAAPEEWAKKARENGHEIWLQLPLENKNSGIEDMGPHALSTRNGFSDNKDNLNWIMTRATGYVGVAGFTDQVFLNVHAMLGQIMRAAFDRGVGYFELNPEGSAFIETLAMGAHAPFGASSMTIDFASDPLLKEIQKTATNNGYASVVLRLTPRNVEILNEWIQSIQSTGFAIAPLSAAAKTVLEEDKGGAESAPTSAHAHE